MIHTAYNELVDPSYVILRLASNYKGKTGNGDKLIVRSLIAPHVDAFYSTPQLASVPDTNVGNGGGSGVSSRASVKVTSNPSSAKEEPASTVATASSSRKSGLFGGVFGGNTNTATNAAVVSSSSSSAKQDWGISDGTGGKLTPQAMDKLMRTMVIPREELDKLLATRNFNHILEAMNIYEMKLSELIIYPESGFVILAQRIKPLKKVYINICHHPSIGIVTEQQQRIYEQIASGDHALQRPSLDHFGGLPVNPNQPIPSPVPFIIGKVDNQFIDSSGNKSMIVDIIIPSPILLYVVADPTGQLRDEVSLLFSSAFSFVVLGLLCATFLL